MARPERNTIDYFPHLLGEGKKMYFIENKYGNNGYATWYKILEKLGSTEYHYLNLNKEEEVMYLAAKCKVSEELLISIINDLSKMDVFHKELWTNKIIWCPQFIESIDDAYKKRNNKCITLDSLRILLTSLGILKPIKSVLKGDVKPQRIEEDSKEDKSIINIEFEIFWNLYNKKVGSKEKLKTKWEKLKDEQRQKIIDTLPTFLNGIKDKQFQPHPETYLNNERWEDELEIVTSQSRHDFLLNAGKM